MLSYEWQFRGSSHVHGFIWLRDAPPVDDLDLDDQESIQNFISFWDPIVSTWNPDMHAFSHQHASSLSYTSLEDTQKELAELLNRVQRHSKCPSSYCSRRNKHTKEVQCRFGFLKDLDDP